MSDREGAAEPAEPVELSDDESAILFQFQPTVSIDDLASSTGIPAARVQDIVERLTDLGLIEAQEPVTPLKLDSLKQDEERDPSLDLESPFDLGFGDPAAREGDDAAEVPWGEVITYDADGKPRRVKRPIPQSDRPAPVQAEEAGETVLPLGVEDEQEEEDPETPQHEEKSAEYKKLFETKYHPLPVDERVALAKTESGNALFALCFDPDPTVIGALFENTGTNLIHVRLIAFHHRSSRGLDHIAGRPDYVRDAAVARRLLRNPALTDVLLRKLLNSKRLAEVYRASIDRDAPEKARVGARGLLRQKFATAAPEERAELVWRTEGRVLILLTGLTFDQKMTKILCSRPVGSVMLIQSLSRFSATPPMLLAHLLRQPLVKRQVHLKNMILQHPNVPSDAKRKL